MGDFVGRYQCALIPVEVPSRRLGPLVRAAGLSLDTSSSDRHFVIVTVGFQLGVRQVAWPFLPPMNYLETIIAIPDAYLAESVDQYVGPFVLPTRLDVDEASPFLVGRSVCYPKFLSRIALRNQAVSVFPRLGFSPLLVAQLEPYGTAGAGDRSPLSDGLVRMLTSPILSRSPFGCPIFTYMNWELDDATIQPVNAEISVRADLPGLPAGRYSVPGYDQQVMGAALLNVCWEAASPFRRQAIRPAAIR